MVTKDPDSKVSIIIPSYNRAAFLGETLDSIRAQTYLNWECQVIDDGSTDHTAELLEFYMERDPRFFYHKRPETRLKGANACRNFGFEICNGEYVNWFDSDDLMHPGKLEKQINMLKSSDGEFCVCQSSVFEQDLNEKMDLRFQDIKSEDFFYDYLIMKIGWLTQSPLWRKDFLDTLKYLFDEDLPAAQEWEFHLRILDKVNDYSILEETLVYLRKHECGITYNRKNDLREWGYFLARLKIYQNKELELGRREVDYLKGYLLNTFKKMLVKKNKYAFKAWKTFIIPEKRIDFSAKTAALISMIFYFVFDRGNFMLQKVKYS